MREIVNGIRVEILPDAEAGADFVAKLALEKIAGGAQNLMVSTGGTFKPIYKRLRAEPAETYRNVRFYNQDEYCIKKGNGQWGMISPDDPQSFRRFMDEELFGAIGVDQRSARSFFPGMQDRRREGSFFDRLINQHGGIDLALLGLGRNCHLGFNEPPDSSFDSRTRFVYLRPETRAVNYNPEIGEPVPPAAITVGLGTIALSNELVVVAFGGHKSAAIHQTVHGEISTLSPSSMVRQPHLAVKTLIVVDEAAAAEL